MRAPLTVLVLVLAVLPWPRSAEAQQTTPHITVRVEQVAGSSLYINAGTRNGVAEGDTLTVRRDSTGAVRGRLVVLASSDTRSVLTFAGRPFPVTRGTTLVLQLLRVPAEMPPEVAPAAAPTLPSPERGAVAPAERVAERGVPPRPAHGRVSFGLSGVRSATRVGTVDPVSVGRTFATPTTGLDLTVPDAIGPLQLRTSMYLAYRYSSQDIVQPAMTARVYAASLDGDFRRFRIRLGRFHSPVASYGGFWDGALLRVGGQGFGIGVIGGFEPDRWDEHPSLSTPKTTVFMDATGGGSDWSWNGSVSAHAVRPTNGLPDHTFFETSQRLSAGPVRFNDELQVDRDPGSGGWRVTRLRLRGSLQLASWLNLHGGVGRLEPWLPGLPGSPFGFRSDRADAGLDVQAPGGFAALDGFVGRDGSGSRTWGATGTFALNRLPGLAGVGASASVSRWSGAYGTTLSAAPSLSINLAPAWLRLGYRLSRADYLGRSTVSHAVDGSLDFPFAAGFRGSARLRVQLGGFLTSQSFNLGLYRAF
ncbi:MAG: hypothetical protein P8099_08445 [Gemmatimonadota bacterium]|jgi:hypothetical protein